VWETTRRQEPNLKTKAAFNEKKHISNIKTMKKRKKKTYMPFIGS
jgi:hypothetical protein